MMMNLVLISLLFQERDLHSYVLLCGAEALVTERVALEHGLDLD